MALNQNHTVEELNGTRCAIVEKNISEARAEFLTNLLNGNGYTVVVVPSAPPKAKAAAPVAEGEEATPETVVEAAPTAFTLGVTDLLFNTINAIYGRMLTTADGHIVTAAYWQQQDAVSHDEVPYYEQ